MIMCPGEEEDRGDLPAVTPKTRLRIFEAQSRQGVSYDPTAGPEPRCQQSVPNLLNATHHERNETLNTGERTCCSPSRQGLQSWSREPTKRQLVRLSGVPESAELQTVNLGERDELLTSK